MILPFFLPVRPYIKFCIRDETSVLGVTIDFRFQFDLNTPVIRHDFFS